MPGLYSTITLRADGIECRPRGVGRCKSCGQSIVWCTTEAGKAIPFDDEPAVVATLNGDLEEVSADNVHWRTCPQAKDFRRMAPAAAKHRELED